MFIGLISRNEPVKRFSIPFLVDVSFTRWAFGPVVLNIDPSVKNLNNGPTAPLIEVLIGLVTIFVRGIGGIFLIVSLLDLYAFSYTYKVRNMSTGETFLMDKPEWKKYRILVKKSK